MASGSELLQVPGPTNLPDEVRAALARPMIDHRGPEFAALARRVLDRLPAVFGTAAGVAAFPASGTGAWEAALANTLSPGDGVLMFETGQFATLWCDLARRLGLDVTFAPGDWRHGVDPEEVERRLAADADGRVRAVAVVHNETSTGVATDVAAVRAAVDRAGHPALLLVDAISSAGSMPYEHDAWGVDVTVAASQKGLMLPPGLGFNVVGERALRAREHARLPRAYWDWEAPLAARATGAYPYTPPTSLFYALDAAVDLLLDEGLDAVFARHARHAEAARRAVEAWGLELVSADRGACSDTLTAAFVPHADKLRELVRERFGVTLGAGLGRLAGRCVRIGHLGSLSDAMLLGVLGAVEAGLLAVAETPRGSGVAEAVRWLAGRA